MKYTVLVYETEQDFSDRDKYIPAYSAYSQALVKVGPLLPVNQI